MVVVGKRYFVSGLLLIIVAFCASCRKDPAVEVPHELAVNFLFTNYAGAEKLKLNDGVYQNEFGDTFTVSAFR